MAMINKGLDNDRRLAILRMSAEAGMPVNNAAEDASFRGAFIKRFSA